MFLFFFSSRRRHTRCSRDWSSDVCSSDVGYHDPGFLVLRISPPHLGLHLGDEGILAQKQSGSHPLRLRQVIAFGWVRFRGLGKQPLDHRLGCPDIRFLGKHRTHGGHAFLVSLFSPSESNFAFPTGGLDHRHALAIDRSDQEWAAVRGEPKTTLPVEAVKIYAGVGDDLLCRAFRKVYAEGIGKFFDRFIKGSLDGGFDQAPLDLVAIGSSWQAQDGVQWIEAVLPPGTIFHARDGNGSKDGDQTTRTEPLVAVDDLLRRALWVDDQPIANTAVAPAIDMGLKHQT